ncbi:MAG: hypothetical protein QNJ85_13470 [Gammaproteobacteria bacterium]|nr:hypothetical protein [Gammaproteobacteria bacterium]
MPPTLDVITYELPGHGTRAKALRDLIFRFSHLVVELGDSVAEFGMNPVIVNHAGCTIVDALVIPR